MHRPHALPWVDGRDPRQGGSGVLVWPAGSGLARVLSLPKGTEGAYVAAAAAAMAASAFCTRTLRVRGVLAPPRELMG